MNSEPNKVPAAFDSVGRLPSEINVPLEDILRNINSARIRQEGLEATLNNDFSQLWEILDNAEDHSRLVDAMNELLGEERPDYSDPTNHPALARVILTAELLNEYAITSTVASCLKHLLDGKSEEMLRACWLGYVMAKRLSSASRQGSFLKEIPEFLKRDKMKDMNRAGKKSSQPWDKFIAAEQMEEVQNKGRPLRPVEFIRKLGGTEPLVKISNGTNEHIGHLVFVDDRCSKLPPISLNKLSEKVRVHNRLWSGVDWSDFPKFIASCEESL
jgi:hypothetical protein